MKNVFGFVKCKVRPPTNLYFPVLPVRVNGKLCFPQCLKCAQERRQEECCHEDVEREMVGSWASVELQLALEKGYTVVFVYETWHYPRKPNTLFRSYVQEHVNMKTEASGWPVEGMSEEEKTNYTRQFQAHSGIVLDRNQIVSEITSHRCNIPQKIALTSEISQKQHMP